MRTRMLGALSAMVLVAAGCGGDDSYDNAERPPAPLNVAIALTSRGVNVSPAQVGGGPVVLLISNQSGRTHDVTLTGPPGSGAPCVDDDVSSGPISPQGNGRVQLSLSEGTCLVGVAGDGLQPAELTVGPERPTAQDDLLQP